MNLVEVGLRIKQCRRDKKLTQEKFAEMIDMSPHYVYEIERGSKAMSIHTLNNIVTCLEVSADYILYGNKSPQNASNNISTPDALDILTHSLSVSKRESAAEILAFLLPYIK